MSESNDNSVAQAALNSVRDAISALGLAPDTAYLVDEDSPPDESLQTAVQIRFNPGTQRHPMSGVGMRNVSMNIAVWGSNQLDPQQQATERVLYIQNITQAIRDSLNQNDLDGQLKVCLTVQTLGTVNPVSQSPGYLRSVDTFTGAYAFAPSIAGLTASG